MLSWLLIVWRLVACGAAGYRVPDMHHLRWTPRKAALVPKRSRLECQETISKLNGSIWPSSERKATKSWSVIASRCHEQYVNCAS